MTVAECAQYLIDRWGMTRLPILRDEYRAGLHKYLTDAQRAEYIAAIDYALGQTGVKEKKK